MTSRKRITVSRITAVQACSAVVEQQPWKGESIAADLLIVAAGFEPRVTAFPRELLEHNSRFSSTVVARYQTNPEDNAARYSELEPILRSLSPTLVSVDADRPETVLAGIRSLSDYQSIRTITFDVSGASSNLIFSVIGSVYELIPNAAITVLYATAASYSAPNAEQEEGIACETTESDVSQVCNNPIFPGHHDDTAGRHILAFPSIQLERMARCLSFCGEAVETLAERNVSWILPSTSHPKHAWRRQRTMEVVSRLIPGSEGDDAQALRQSDLAFSDCDVLSPRDAALQTLTKAEANRGKNLFLIHMGSKLQALGCALALCARSEITLVSARPGEFNASGYSAGVGSLWRIDIPSLRDVVEGLLSAGEIQMGDADGTQLV